MGDLLKLLNVDRLLRKLQKIELESKAKYDGSVVVGYTSSYALYVHENLEMKWRGLPRSGFVKAALDGGKTKKYKVGSGKKGGKGFYWDPPGQGQSQFLIQPMREMGKPGGELAKTVVDALDGGATMVKALLVAGLQLQRASQQLVPVDTGNLRASAVTVEG
jgi:hypothetical protein